MKRILIVGNGGAGKSTLARKLGEKFNLPVIHMDVHFWNPGWKETPEDEWREKVRALSEKEEWIMDGNFGRSADLRFPRADAIIFLDMPRWLSIFRIMKRWYQYSNESRPDMAEGSHEKVDWEFYKWVWNFKKRSIPQFYKNLETYGKEARFYHLKSQTDVDRFMELKSYE